MSRKNFRILVIFQKTNSNSKTNSKIKLIFTLRSPLSKYKELTTIYFKNSITDF